MIREGKMTEEGQRLINIAKKNGRWHAANKVDVVPADLKNFCRRINLL